MSCRRPEAATVGALRETNRQALLPQIARSSRKPCFCRVALQQTRQLRRLWAARLRPSRSALRAPTRRLAPHLLQRRCRSCSNFLGHSPRQRVIPVASARPHSGAVCLAVHSKPRRRPHRSCWRLGAHSGAACLAGHLRIRHKNLSRHRPCHHLHQPHRYQRRGVRHIRFHRKQLPTRHCVTQYL